MLKQPHDQQQINKRNFHEHMHNLGCFQLTKGCFFSVKNPNSDGWDN